MGKDEIVLWVYNNKEIDRYLRYYSNDNDIKNDLYIELDKMDSIKIIDLYNKNELKWYCFGIIKQIFIKDKNKEIELNWIKHNKYKGSELVNPLLLSNKPIINDDNLIRITYEELDNYLRCNTHPTDYTLFHWKYKMGMTGREIEELSGMKQKSVFTRLTKIRRQIKNKFGDGYIITDN